MRSATRLLIAAGWIGPVYYFLWLGLMGWLVAGYNPLTTGMSELGAVDSPVRDAMNYLGFSLLGVMMAAFGIGFGMSFRRGGVVSLVSGLMILAGVSMFVVGFLPCDSGCVDVTATGRWHSTVSTLPAILMPLAAMLAARPLAISWGMNWGKASFVLGLLSMASGPVMLWLLVDDWTGLVQRLGIGLSLVWMAAVAWRRGREMVLSGLVDSAEAG